MRQLTAQHRNPLLFPWGGYGGGWAEGRPLITAVAGGGDVFICGENYCCNLHLAPPPALPLPPLANLS